MNYIVFSSKVIKVPIYFKRFITEFGIKNLKNMHIFGSRLLKILSSKKKKYIRYLPQLSKMFILTVGLRLKTSFNKLVYLAYCNEKFYFGKNTHKTNHSFNSSKNEIIFKKKHFDMVNFNDRSQGFKMFEKFTVVMSSTFNVNFVDPNILGLQYLLYAFNFRYFGKKINDFGIVGHISHFKNFYIKKVWFIDNSIFEYIKYNKNSNLID